MAAVACSAAMPRLQVRAPSACVAHPRAAAACRVHRCSRRSLRVVAEQNGFQPGTKQDGLIDGFRRSCDRFLTRYDFLSTGLGALSVTTFCVMRGQDPGTAATITVGATVAALVLNEVLFTSEDQQ